jgi:hypothetical protein
MHRTQLILEPWQYDALRAMADKEGESISGLVRRALTAFLGRAPTRRKARLDDIEGLFDDPGASGREHDRFLYGRGEPTRPAKRTARSRRPRAKAR